MNASKKLVSRVPEITIIFWIIKILSTTVGETCADFLAFGLNLGMTTVAFFMSSIMAVLLIIQFSKLNKYIPANYWAIVILMSIIGTLITDILVDDLGVSLVTLSIIFTLAMLAGFLLWYRSEHTLSIHSINTNKREAYYWFIILIAFALGTGLGDLISEHLALGYGYALFLFAGLIASIAFNYYAFKLNAILIFWFAYLLTRPLGASLGDYLIQPTFEGGLGLDMLSVNVVFFTTIVALIGYLTVKNRST